MLAGQQATNFKVKVVIDGRDPLQRSAPASPALRSMTTATRAQVLSVFLQAMAARDVTLTSPGAVPVREQKDPKAKRRPKASDAGSQPQAELKPGQTRKEVEGVFTIVNTKEALVHPREGCAPWLNGPVMT